MSAAETFTEMAARLHRPHVCQHPPAWRVYWVSGRRHCSACVTDLDPVEPVAYQPALSSGVVQ